MEFLMKTTKLRIDVAIEFVQKYDCEMYHWRTGKVITTDNLFDKSFTYDEITIHDWSLRGLKYYNFTEAMDALLDGKKIHWMNNDELAVELKMVKGNLVTAIDESPVVFSEYLFRSMFLLLPR
jgi:hypothetical protein